MPIRQLNVTPRPKKQTSGRKSGGGGRPRKNKPVIDTTPVELPYICRTAEEAAELLKQDTEIAFDSETTGLSPYHDEIAVVQMYGNKSRIPIVLHPFDDVLFIKELCETKLILTHNGTTFDLLFLKNLGITVKDHWDTFVGEKVIDTFSRFQVKKSLAATMQRRLGTDFKVKRVDHNSWANYQLTDNQLYYAISDVMHMHEIKEAQLEMASVRKITEALLNEQELTKIMVEIMFNGMYLDRDTFNKVKKDLTEDIKRTMERAKEYLGDINFNAPKQLLPALRQYDSSVVNTRQETLLDISAGDDIFSDVVKIKQYLRRTGMYSDDFYEEFCKDNFLHGKLNQLGTQTTRMSSSDPNMQQIPRNLRFMFGGRKGHKVVFGDFSTVEARCTGDTTNDRRLINACATQDPYVYVAERLFRQTVTPELRQLGKAAFLAWCFVGGKPSFRRQLKMASLPDMPDHELMEILNSLGEEFPDVKKWHRWCAHKAATSNGRLTIRLPWGHSRDLVGTNLTPQKISNTMVQGAAAVGIKEALFEAKKIGILEYISNVVHDEVVCSSVPEDKAEEVAEKLHYAMIHGMEKIMRNGTPVAAEVKIADTWRK